jgi:hypothetical protein
MRPYLEVEVRRATGLANRAKQLTPRHACPCANNDARRIEMPVQGIDSTAVCEGMLHHDRSLISAPAERIGVRHLTVTYTVDGNAKTGATICVAPPIFASVNAAEEGAVDAKAPPKRDVFAIRWIHRVIQRIDKSAGRTRNRLRA